MAKLSWKKLSNAYAPGKDFPLGAYATMAALHHVGLLGLWRAAGRAQAPARLSLHDLLLLCGATHKLSRIVTRDWVTSPFRAPFTEYVSAASGGEVDEKPRGRGWRKAVGDLVTCNFCMGPWVALTLLAGWTVRPRETRTVMALFTAVAASDFLHRAYSRLEKGTSLVQERTKELERQGEETSGSRVHADTGREPLIERVEH